MMRRYLAIFAMLLLMGTTSARADTLLSGFGGVALGGATDRTRVSWGGSLGFIGNTFGFEAEFSTTPEFFGNSDQGDVFTNNNVLTMMGNVMVASPGPVRIYGTVGAGLMKTRLEDPDNLFSIDSNDFGINVGGGIIGFLSDNVGLRADVRYFRDLQDTDPDGAFDIDLGNVDYWRIVGGITFKF
jgi:opacity protein-like surface antigen